MNRKNVTDKKPHDAQLPPAAEVKATPPLSLEEAVAMAPSNAPQPFAASTAAIAWGAVRSGMSVWEYIIGMTREFEERLQTAYDAWKAENAWYSDKPGEQAQKGDAAEPIVSATAESIVSAAVEPIPSAAAEPIVSAVAEPIPSSQPAKVEKKNAVGPTTELNRVLVALPKEPDPALYETILATTDRETLKAALETLIEKRKCIHRPRTAQAAFLQWLEEAQNE